MWLESRKELEEDLLARLKKIEGQVRGVSKMIQEKRACGEIIIQLAAIKSALNQVAMTTLACHLADLLRESLEEKRDLKKAMEEFLEIFKKFS